MLAGLVVLRWTSGVIGAGEFVRWPRDWAQSASDRFSSILSRLISRGAARLRSCPSCNTVSEDPPHYFFFTTLAAAVFALSASFAFLFATSGTVETEGLPFFALLAVEDKEGDAGVCGAGLEEDAGAATACTEARNPTEVAGDGEAKEKRLNAALLSSTALSSLLSGLTVATADKRGFCSPAELVGVRDSGVDCNCGADVERGEEHNNVSDSSSVGVAISASIIFVDIEDDDDDGDEDDASEVKTSALIFSSAVAPVAPFFGSTVPAAQSSPIGAVVSTAFESEFTDWPVIPWPC